MYSKILTGTLIGIEGETVSVETDLTSGLPNLIVVGLAELSVREGKERIRSAIVNSGYLFPSKKIIINLSPANSRKEGTHFDLPLAIGVLCSAGKIRQEDTEGYAFIGELSLDGNVNGVTGALPLLIGLWEQGIRRIILPEANLAEVSLLKEVELYSVKNLREVVEHLTGEKEILQKRIEVSQMVTERAEALDYIDVYGQEQGKHCLVLACGAMHGILLNGPPGVGKSLLAKRIPSILPPLSYEEQLEVTKIYSIAGYITKERPLMSERPFRAPHYTISSVALTGGGSHPKPGEISLAHRGVLFLDEFPQFEKRTLEMLRTPMEDGKIMISRVNGSYTFPSEFMLVAAMNPCRCGFYRDEQKQCTCTPQQIQNYYDRLSGPLMDRIDIQITLPRPGMKILCEEGKRKEKQMSSLEMRNKVLAIREMQKQRYRKETIEYNSQLTPALIIKYCVLEKEARTFLYQGIEKMALSVRAYHKTLKLARTIADGEGKEMILLEHVAEALQYRGNFIK